MIRKELQDITSITSLCGVFQNQTLALFHLNFSIIYSRRFFQIQETYFSTMTSRFSILRDIFSLYSVFFFLFARTLFCGNSDNHYNLTEGKSCHHPRRKSPFFTNVKKRRFIVISHMRQKVNTEMNCVALKKLSAA